MALVPVNGIRLNVEVHGQGMPVIMLHGFTGDLTTWRPLAAALGGRYTTALVDLIGHGESDAPEDPARYSMERCVDDLLTLADRLEISEAVWLGYSMGGRVGLSLGATAPERCRALILEGASGGIESERERATRVSTDRALAIRIEDRGVASFVEHWESQALFSGQARMEEQVRIELRWQRLGNRATGLANSLRGMGTGAQPSVYHRLPGFRKPTLFLAGEEDQKFLTLARTMSDLTPNGDYASIPKAGHCAHLENPKEFETKVCDFLNSVDGNRYNGSTAGLARGARGQSVV